MHTIERQPGRQQPVKPPEQVKSLIGSGIINTINALEEAAKRGDPYQIDRFAEELRVGIRLAAEHGQGMDIYPRELQEIQNRMTTALIEGADRLVRNAAKVLQQGVPSLVAVDRNALIAIEAQLQKGVKNDSTEAMTAQRSERLAAFDAAVVAELAKAPQSLLISLQDALRQSTGTIGIEYAIDMLSKLPDIAQDFGVDISAETSAAQAGIANVFETTGPTAIQIRLAEARNCIAGGFSRIAEQEMNYIKKIVVLAKEYGVTLTMQEIDVDSNPHQQLRTDVSRAIKFVLEEVEGGYPTLFKSNQGILNRAAHDAAEQGVLIADLLPDQHQFAADIAARVNLGLEAIKERLRKDIERGWFTTFGRSTADQAKENTRALHAIGLEHGALLPPLNDYMAEIDEMLSAVQVTPSPTTAA